MGHVTYDKATCCSVHVNVSCMPILRTVFCVELVTNLLAIQHVASQTTLHEPLIEHWLFSQLTNSELQLTFVGHVSCI